LFYYVNFISVDAFFLFTSLPVCYYVTDNYMKAIITTSAARNDGLHKPSL